jgi:hypothetical protein
MPNTSEKYKEWTHADIIKTYKKRLKKNLKWTLQPTRVNKLNTWSSTWNWDDPINSITKTTL